MNFLADLDCENGQLKKDIICENKHENPLYL